MKEKALVKIIAIEIIFLFIGVSFSSAISVDTKSTTYNNEIIECRECQDIIESYLIIFERLVNKVEIYSKLLMVLSNDNIELTELSEELSNRISTILMIINNNPIELLIICGYLLLLFSTVGFTGFFMNQTAEKFKEGSVLKTLFKSLEGVFIQLMIGVLLIAKTFNCQWAEYIEPRIS